MKRILPILISIFSLVSCSSDSYVRISGYAQGGTYMVTCKVHGAGPKAEKEAAALKDGIDSILNVIDRSVSGYNKTSLLTRYNSGEEIACDGSAEYAVFAELTSYCDSLYIATGGALDTRSAELYDIWGFGFKSGEMPDKEQIEAARSQRRKMNFNAVAQGYSADCIAGYLEDRQICNYLINIGGEMMCNGVNPYGKSWKIGIDAPIDGNMTPGGNMSGTFCVQEGRRLGIVTSGNYRKFYVRDGVKYSHTIDPRAGYPVQHNLLSATIIAGTSALADAMATYCMVVGMDEAIKTIDSRPDLEGCLISSDTTWCSAGLILNQ